MDREKYLEILKTFIPSVEMREYLDTQELRERKIAVIILGALVPLKTKLQYAAGEDYEELKQAIDELNLKSNELFYLIDIIDDEKADKETILSGFKQLDRLTKGFKKSDLVYIGARPGMGKTTFAVNLAENITMAGNKCAFFSLELSTEYIAKKFLQYNSSMKIYIDDNPAPTVSEIKQKVKDLKDVDCVVIDYLGLIKSEIKRTDRTQEIYDISKELKRMAKELDISVICITQLPRYEGKPKLSDSRECAFIERNADVVLFLHRDDFTSKNIDDMEPDITELIIAKNKYGDIGTVRLKYNFEAKKFTEEYTKNYE